MIKKNEETIACFSEYDALHKVIVCEPDHMRISEVINETQRRYVKDNIDAEVAVQQHRHFVSAMQKEGIEVLTLPSFERYPEQVFTRDIGFTLGNTLFISEMGKGIRQGEEQVLMTWLREHGYSYHNLEDYRIEGGDVIIDRDRIFIGVSDRTCSDAIAHLQEQLPAFTVIPIPFNERYLHLDCVFNIISPTEALVFLPALSKKERKLLASYYHLIEVSQEEQFTLGTNVLSIGQQKILSLPVNPGVNTALRERGYHVIEVDITEIIKSGGSFRCCTMPVVRIKS
ncbi:dimethylarginine dimethylaminohydrolase family protein [Priestia koreensis]|uniref:N-Dimethylarginine dimethylaminohydrolase n=1 Tax=Priestia koreensis TaxID=284581 RepID=A0A0M0KVD9_9BACI|nr:dimethylarginine dimethylaminohydrolase family protein [Priestia koreensis]KOO42779.1 hypothetical protein AMD01_16680 [Priestia koreensis]